MASEWLLPALHALAEEVVCCSFPVTVLSSAAVFSKSRLGMFSGISPLRVLVLRFSHFFPCLTLVRLGRVDRV